MTPPSLKGLQALQTQLPVSWWFLKDMTDIPVGCQICQGVSQQMVRRELDYISTQATDGTCFFSFGTSDYWYGTW